MRHQTISQWVLGGNPIKRFGDHVSGALFDTRFSVFKFATAYMRLSGLDRLMPGIEALLNRGGVVSGAVGIDDHITSADALEELIRLSATSTVVHSDIGPIVHLKMFVFSGATDGLVIVGSANVTRDGLYRNIEYGVELAFDFSVAHEAAEFSAFQLDIDGLLTPGSNAFPLDLALLRRLETESRVLRENASTDPNGAPRRKRSRTGANPLFPPMVLPAPPPRVTRRSATSVIQQNPLPSTAATIFVMELSAFDSSHRSGVRGTPEVLIPNDAMPFFPAPTQGARMYPDTKVNVILNDPLGPQLHDYRLWIYPVRTENRLRMNHATLDLANPGGGDLVVFSRVSNPLASYELTIVAPADAGYAYYRSLCVNNSNGKPWGTA